MTYPIILAIVCTVVVIFLLTSIMPTFVGMYSSSGVELPKITQILISISNNLQIWWPALILVIVAIVFAMSILNKNPKVRLKEDYYKLKNSNSKKFTA